MSDPTPDLDAELGAGETRPYCAKDMKRYFLLIGIVALIVLFGAIIWRQSSGGGLKLSTLMAQFDTTKVANAPVDMVPAGKQGAPQAVIAAIPMVGGQFGTQGAPMSGGPVLAGSASGSAPGMFSNVVSVLRNSVVSVMASSAAAGNVPDPAAMLGGGGLDGQMHFASPLTRSVENIGSGVVVRSDGYILTNYHVVRGANSVFVTVQDDFGSNRYSADIVKMDDALDLALLKISPKASLSPAVLGNSDLVNVADEVITIGSPFSRGIISAKRKSMVIEGVTHTNLLQTDAAINQGNSGGPLVATNGAVIGINTAIYTPNGAFAGIGFAVSSNLARKFVMDEIATLPVSSNEGPALGLVALTQQVAMPRQSLGPAGPAIAANAPAPHTDGRENMDCAMCHEIIGGPNAGRSPTGMTVAAPAVSPPPIKRGTQSPHTDGRQNMDCAMCHQILPGNAGVTGQVGTGMTVAGMGANPYSFAAPPGSLAMNVVQAQGQAAAPSTGSHVVMGATLSAMSPTLSQQTGQPAGRGVFVGAVSPGSPAALADLKAGDIVVKVDGRPVASPQDVVALLAAAAPGQSVRLGVIHEGELRGSQIVVGAAGMTIAAPAGMMTQQNAPNSGMGQMAQPGQMMQPGQLAQPGMPPKPRVPTEFNWLGLEIETFQAVQPMAGGMTQPGMAVDKGAVVGEVLMGSRAALAGLRINDILVEVNNRLVTNAAQLDAAIKSAAASAMPIVVKVNRNGQEFVVAL